MADQTLRALTRKFGGSAKVWLRQMQWHLGRGQGEQARKTLDRALNALPKRKHIKASAAPGCHMLGQCAVHCQRASDCQDCSPDHAQQASCLVRHPFVRG